MHPTLRLGALLSAVLFSAAAHGADAIDVAKLSDSSVTMVDLSKAGSPGKTFAAGTIINAPIQDVCALLQNYSAYPSFMPNTASAKATPADGGQTLVDITLKLPMGKIKKYRLRMTPKVSAASCVLAWKLVPWPGLKQEETILDTTGQWQLTPGATPDKTVVRYNVYTDPGPIPFGLGWIVDSLSKDSIPQTLDAVRKRVVQH
ncbi:SRPBCC family protein [Massilia sp. CF038]|uniref:SRPBCC family protein n=1 Tax=Massilia sp. CF038 TaxID=1881045 RepID=UPI0009239F9F|nr:SRPBCC family protein [Massilia sp. CF038]SHG47704.1 Polyketide cyclase / dehydrase and lipid transport [Massilia sp. CF038]